MADRIKGITIEIDGNTEKLSKSLEGVNKEIKSTQSQLKDVEKLLKMDPGNLELLRQKQQLLTTAVTDTTTKLNTLKEALKQMENSGVDKNSAEYQALQREIIATEGELKNLKEAAKDANATVAAIKQACDKVSEGANKVADATKGLSAAAGGALVGLAGLGIKAAANADDLNTMAKQTGLATDELQKMQYASDLIDVPVDTITGSLKKLKKNLTSTSKDVQAAWEQIGVSVTSTDGELRDISDIFYETLQGFQKSKMKPREIP